jgi:hypothetical protein
VAGAGPLARLSSGGVHDLRKRALSMLPIADFLAGSLLTLLMPVALLIALVAWYWWFSARVPETAKGDKTARPAAASNPGPAVSENLPPEPGV